jgi:hypothetical protein
MLERQLVQSVGFRNTGSPGARDGFEFRLRLPYYRGMPASLCDGVDVSVDGETFGFEHNRVVLGGRELSLAELREAVDVRWSIDAAAIVRVRKAGGLAVGVHEISVAVRLRQSYFPPEFQPSIVTETRTATIVL